MYSVGFDLGSRTTKVVFWNIENQAIDWFKVETTGISPNKTANLLFEAGCKILDIKKSEITNIFSTGYGRKILSISEKQISEISCHAKGVLHFIPTAKTVIDIGGQDSKVIAIAKNGRVKDFAMNDKCAAGTGRFLEKSAVILEAELEDISKLALQSSKEIEISSTCVVFAESEIIGLIAKGTKRTDILHAVNLSVAKRIKNLITKISIQDDVVFTGGVANNNAMRNTLEKSLKCKILRPETPAITGALGAALFAANM